MLSENILPSMGTESTALVAERRITVRYDADASGAGLPSKGAERLCWIGNVKHLFAGGFGMVISHRFKPGTTLRVQVHQRDQSLSRALRARVIHVTQARSAGEWFVGCSFVPAMGDAEFQNLR